MSLGPTADARYGDVLGWHMFVLANALAHAQIGRRIDTLKKIEVLQRPIYDSQNTQDWLMEHAQMHQAELAAMGYPGTVDLSQVDLKSEDAYYEWMFEHAQIHAQVQQALGI